MKLNQLQALRQIEGNLNIKIKEYNSFINHDYIYELREAGDIYILRLKAFEVLDITALLPFESSIEYLSLEDGIVVNFDKITQFSKLTDLRLEKVNIIELPIKTRYKKPCFLKKIEIKNYEEIVFDIRELLPIAPYIECLVIEYSALEGQETLKYFTNLKELEFYETNEINVEYLLPIAHSIEKLIFYDTSIKHIDKLSHFTNLKVLDLELLDNTLTSFKPFSSLAKKLQELRIVQYTGVIKDFYLIKSFILLKELVCWIDSVAPKDLAAICSLGKLKLLYLTVFDYTKSSIDLSKLKSLEALKIYIDKVQTITGFEHLKNLKKLYVESEFKEIKGLERLKNLRYLKFDCVDVDKIPRIESLKILNIIEANNIKKGLEQFPNLEELKIETAKNFPLGALKHLKVLELKANGEELEGISHLESLEKLNLRGSILKEIEEIRHLKKLKVLNLAKNNINNLKCLEQLTKLEELDLEGNICLKEDSDLEILKQLPSLKKINLGNTGFDEDVAKKVLKDVEHVLFTEYRYIFAHIKPWDDYSTT